MPAVLTGIASFTIVLWVIALCLAIGYIVGTIAGVFRPIPVVGGPIAGAMESMAQAITGAGQGLLKGLDGAVGASWHWMSRYLELSWKAMTTGASINQLAAAQIHRHAVAIRRVGNAAHRAASVADAHTGKIARVEREIHGIDRELKKLEREIGNGIGADVLPRIKTLERELGKIESQVIPRVENAESALANDITQLGEYVRANFLSSATDAVTAAVAVALGALGLGGLRCNGLLNSLTNRGCGLWHGLEDLLGLFVDVFLLTNVCELIPLLETAVSEVADPLVIALTDIGAGLCSGGIGAAPTLQVPALSLPANPGVTLNLP